MERKFKGIWIPAELWNSKGLSLQEKCLIAEIDSFTEFWMSNKAIGEFLGVSKDRAKQIVAKMKDGGIINVETTRDAETKQILKRTITVSNDFKRKIFEASLNKKVDDYPSGVENSPRGGVENSPRGGVENYPESNKSFYNKSSLDNKGDKPPALPQVSKKSKRFVKPTLDDVQAYCQERQNHVDPESFIDFYESKGWYVGKNKMKDWKAAVRTWERRNKSMPRRMSRAERQRAEDAELERMCKEYDSRHGETDSNDTPWKLSG
ncbi:hypothetical protein [Megasphaera sp.]|uniref:hypothetical protein n=1 Tax=Megasphaera sp. TaxID=2023260 RepID=UPI00307CEB4B